MTMIDTQVIRIAEQTLLISIKMNLITLTNAIKDAKMPDAYERGAMFSINNIAKQVEILEKESKKRA